MKKILSLLIVLILIFILFGIYLLKSDYSNAFAKKIKDNTPNKIKTILKQTIFYIPTTNRKILVLENQLSDLNETNNKLRLEKIKLQNKIDQSKFLLNDLTHNKYSFNSFILPFFDDEDIYGNKKGGYIDFYGKHIVIAFASGKIIFIEKNEIYNKKLKYFEVENNIKENFDQKISWTGVKDIKIINNHIYLSLTKQIKENCYNTSLYKSNLNHTKLFFEEIFSPSECFEISKQIKAFKYFNGAQSGGRIVNNKEYLYLTLGDYNYWEQVQKIESFAGKILKFDIINNKHEILSIGHRNPQGLYFSKEYNHLISTEHGPKGGDEINVIKLNSLSTEIQNLRKSL